MLNIFLADVSDAHAHTTRFDGQVSPGLQFFLDYYHVIIVGIGLLVFGWLWYRNWRRERRLVKQ
jgi:hypothetical protein